LSSWQRSMAIFGDKPKKAARLIPLTQVALHVVV